VKPQPPTPAPAPVREASFWDQRYVEHDTPWDKGAPHPGLAHWLQDGAFGLGREKVSRVLVPGCGRGHDALELARHFPAVLGVDFSAEALRRATATDEHLPHLQFAQADFLAPPIDWTAQFDLIFEHTCFCAIDPATRQTYVQSCSSLLQAGGWLAGFFFTNLEREGGPPFGVSPEELAALFAPHFTLLDRRPVSTTFPGREGEEELWLWRRN
jgi:SAM-dependent methyltransferase